MGSATQTLEILIGGKTQASLKKALSDASNGFGLIGKAAASVTGKITELFSNIDITSFMSDAMDVYAGFEQTLANTAAIAQATSSEYEKLSEAAKEAGRTSIYTAEQSAEALGFMSLAGWDVDTSTQALDSVLKISTATQADIKTTSDLITDTISAVGLGVDQLDMYLDKVIQANNSSNTSAEQLMDALAGSGGAARTLGASLDDTITALGILANNAVKGSEAGTALNSMMSRIGSNPTAQKELKALGASIYDANGNFVGFEEALKRINSALSGLSEQQKMSSLRKIAGTHYFSQMTYLLDSVTESADGTGTAFSNLKGKIESSDGALDKMYNTTTDTVSVAEELLKDAVDIGKLEIAEPFAPAYKESLRWLANTLPTLTDKVVDFANAHRYDIINAFDKAREVITSFAGKLSDAFSWILEHGATIAQTVTTVVVAFEALTILKTVTNLAIQCWGAFTTLIGAISTLAIACPALFALGAAAVAVAAGIGVVAGNAAKAKVEFEELKNQNLAEHFGNISLSLEQIDQIASSVVSSKNLSKIENVVSVLEEVDNIAKNLSTDSNKINQLNYLMSVGVELSYSQQEEYKSVMESYISDLQNYINNKRYAITLSVEALVSDGLRKNIILNELNSFYDSKQSQLNELGTKLNEAITNAFTDGLLDIDEAKEISELQAQMSSIQQKMAQSEYNANINLLGMKFDLTNLDYDSFQLLAREIDANTSEAKEKIEQAYVDSVANLDMMLNDTSTSYYLADYQKDKAALDAGYLKQMGSIESQSLEFLTDSITSSYQATITQSQNQLKDRLEELLSDHDLETPGVQAYDGLIFSSSANWKDIISSTETAAQGAMAEILENIEPTYQSLVSIRDKCIAAGESVPSSIAEGIASYEQLAAVGGSTDAIYTYIAEIVSNNPEYLQSLNYVVEQGGEIPAQLGRAITDRTGDTTSAIGKLYGTTQSTIKNTFSNPIDASVTINLRFKEVLDKTWKSNAYSIYQKNQNSLNYVPSTIQVKQNALGGIYNSPILTTFAEDGPEAAIPINNTARAKSLLLETASRMGMLKDIVGDNIKSRVATFDFGKLRESSALYTYNNSSDSTVNNSNSNTDNSKSVNITVSYNPSITVSGSTTQEDIKSAMSLSLDELKSMLNQITLDNNRLSFGGA